MEITCLDVAKAAELEAGSMSGDEHCFKCPRHRDKHPSLMVNVKKNCWMCGPCGAGGNAWELAAFLAGLDPKNEKKAVVTWLQEHGLLKEAASNKRRLSGWQRVWDDTVPAADRTAQPLTTYLANRGLNSDDIPKSIRFHPALGYYATTDKKNR